jgi:hypothetical protein
MRTLFQGAHQKLRIVEPGGKIVCQTGAGGTQPRLSHGFGPACTPGSHSSDAMHLSGISRFGAICYPQPCFAIAVVLRILNQTFELKRRTDASD